MFQFIINCNVSQINSILSEDDCKNFICNKNLTQHIRQYEAMFERHIEKTNDEILRMQLHFALVATWLANNSHFVCFSAAFTTVPYELMNSVSPFCSESFLIIRKQNIAV